MKHNSNYFVLKKPPLSLWQSLLFIIKIPISLPSWIISFLLARMMANIVLSPTYAKTQKPIHLVRFSDDPTEKGTVVINLLPKDPHKTFHDYLLKFSSVFHLPFLAKLKKRQLSFKNPKDKAHIDQIITEIDLLITGQSTTDKCQHKTFKWTDIHLKGLEYLDDELRNYLFAKLRAKYGSEADTPPTTTMDFFTLETPDDAVLDSVALSAESEQDKPMAERKFVIVCLANGQSYIDWLKDFNVSAKEIGCTIIGFNYRGIDYSQGMIWTQNNMVDDTIAQVKRLLALGAKAENIGLEGMCVGGVVATIAAAKLHDEGLKVKLYNERSFRSAPHLLAGTVLPDAQSSLWSPVTLGRYLIAGLVFAIFTPIVWLAGWHLDAASAWDKIPLADKNYSVIRNPRDIDPKAPKTDGIIEDSWASMASLMDEKRAEIIEKKQRKQALTEEEEALLSDQPETHQFKVNPQFELKNKTPHVIARRHLIQTDGPLHMHQHMIASFKSKFFRTSTISPNSETTTETNHALSL
ncbi:alpha/beta hydrolase [Legionella oakridgensis]|nr:alpha/beta hydrolase [Legionella oakridgensis]KTD44759.1 SdbA protein, substrate of the Dot/Icm system [Legionella oakridgensis]STY16147.1 SdbA protein, substrate of the Dot/Icm system [Legionella longbeachae]